MGLVQAQRSDSCLHPVVRHKWCGQMQCQIAPGFLEMGLFTVGWPIMFLVADILPSMYISLVVGPESHCR